ncbi:putative aldouronate transport system permease protein [Paenibacillus sp. 1_12]|uniref:ABC transporter permease n=1 Tax=Paenibacillus sp. 1_12 TaxID=1566278 RepID=UPI0008EE38CF|nr:ABC transporter permease subunit [Paenibacillus sp. 1_12]SFM27270.1 putative aldouronate transport system permease protein [Paenibacillus sp. 1_12]
MHEALPHQKTIAHSRAPRGFGLWQQLIKYRYIYLLTLPGMLYFILFKFGPMWGLLISFQDYNPFQGFWGSEWVGFKHFRELFVSEYFYIMARNTFLINIFGLVFSFPLPILLALMLNEIRHEAFKRINQTIIYLPHFLSWVVVASMTFFMLSTDVGIINKIMMGFGMKPVSFLSNPNYFWGLITAQGIWKDAGWGTIIFLAAMAGVDPQRYEAAVVDGASRLRQIWHITLPAIRPTIIILLILRLGHIADVGFEQLLLMQNSLVLPVAEVFDTYAFNQGIVRGQISVGVAVGMFKGLVGLVLVMSSNFIIKKMGHEGIY